MHTEKIIVIFFFQVAGISRTFYVVVTAKTRVTDSITRNFTVSVI